MNWDCCTLSCDSPFFLVNGERPGEQKTNVFTAFTAFTNYKKYRNIAKNLVNKILSKKLFLFTVFTTVKNLYIMYKTEMFSAFQLVNAKINFVHQKNSLK